MSKALESLLELLDLEQIEENIFRGYSPKESRGRIFGGQVAAQALMAAGRTLNTGSPLKNDARGDDRRASVHSLHSYFLLIGDPTVPILYEVDRIRDGRSFTTRRVVAIQHGKAIFHLSASFHIQEDGLEHQLTMPKVPMPEELPTLQERLLPLKDQSKVVQDLLNRPHPIDTRHIGELPWEKDSTGVVGESKQRLWFKTDGVLPDDPLLHACVVAYASDMYLIFSILIPHGVKWFDPGFMGASLDHCMWFHRPFRADKWLLYDQQSPVAFGARGLALGSIFDQNGTLVVSVSQEGLVRVGKTRP
ncbi:MAG: acyl-CoA thioesterase II [Actinobacteria bacterium]|nr:acyl-CoA thioesterase II [Actinomycetota bacterium]MCL6104897.1 acyl-CoA thioesterase II [Actinomycetota bacterium]